MRWRGLKLRWLGGLLAVAIALPAVVFADQISDEATRRAREDLNREEILREQKARYVRSLQDLAILPVHQVNQIFKLRIERRLINLVPLIDPTPQFVNRRANLQGFNSPAMVAYCQWFANEPEARQFEFHIEDYPDKLTTGILRLLWRT